jgi:single-strand DNA-binding protein
MANLNKVMLIGRLTRDPESRTFSNGGKVVNFGFAVNNKKRNQSTGQWDDDPVFIDAAIFNRGENGRQADLFEQSLRKGQQVFLEGHLKFDQWTSPEGQKRSKLSVVVDNFQFLEPRGDGSGGGNQMARGAYGTTQSFASAPQSHGGYEEHLPDMESSAERAPDAGIPF